MQYSSEDGIFRGHDIDSEYDESDLYAAVAEQGDDSSDEAPEATAMIHLWRQRARSALGKSFGVGAGLCERKMASVGGEEQKAFPPPPLSMTGQLTGGQEQRVGSRMPASGCTVGRTLVGFGSTLLGATTLVRRKERRRRDR